MTFDQWFFMFVHETVRIMDIQSNLLMGGITTATMLLLVIFNNYGWRRAFIMTIFTTAGVGGWYWIGSRILGNSIYSGSAFTIVVYTILLCLYTVVGYLIAGVVVMLKPHPVVKMRRALVWSLNGMASLSDTAQQKFGNLLVYLGQSMFKEGAASRSLRKVAAMIPTENHKEADKQIQKELRSTLLDIVKVEEV